MALLSGRLTDVYASLDRYLQATLVDAAGVPFALRLHGQRLFSPPLTAPWIEAHYDFLGLEQRSLNVAGGRQPLSVPVGTERAGFLQLNGYQRANTFSRRYTTAAIRDAVLTAFPEGGLLFIRDWDAAEANARDPLQQATLVFDGVRDHVADTGLDSGLIQVVLEVRTRYWEVMTRA